MNATSPPSKPASLRRRWVFLAAAVVLAAAAVVAAMVLPYWTDSHEFPVHTAGSGTSISVKIPYPGEVTVRFAQHNAQSMSYWVRGPGAMAGAGAMTMGLGGATYSFWSWGGEYQLGAGAPVRACGIACVPPASGEVWANVTTGLL
jgi:hypothetical protein